MKPLVMYVCYVCVHFNVYLIFRKKIDLLKSEKGIFWYHFASFIITVSLVMLLAALNDIGQFLYISFAFLSIHGIYSLSFLELWSLSQGSYSLSILNALPIIKNNDRQKIEHLEKIGDQKFSSRIIAIERLNLIVMNNNKIYLTRLGSIVTNIFYMITKLNNITDRG